MGRHTVLVVRQVDYSLDWVSLRDEEMQPSFLMRMKKEVDDVQGEADYIGT